MKGTPLHRAPFPPPGKRLPTLQDVGRFRVHNILLVSTLYDSFMLSEDGQLSEAILREFIRLDPYGVPAIARVSTGDDALRLARSAAAPDLVVMSMRIGDMRAPELAERLRAGGFTAPLVALAHDAHDLQEGARPDVLDRVFLWQGDFRILPAIVKDVEDRRNVDADTGELGVQAIILIEDSVHFYSSFLPAIYAELVRHSQALAPEGLNASQRLLRIRARPKILLCHTYEEAWGYFERYEEHILGVVSDMEFPHEGRLRADAGLDFARRIRARQPDVPVMLQSATADAEPLARAAGATFLQKGSPTLLHQLQAFMIDNFGFGDFVFRRPDGTTVARAATLKALEEQLHVVPPESIAYHAERNHFSTWLKARTEFALAYRLRPRRVSDYPTVEDLRADLIREIHQYRERLNRGIVADFEPESFDPAASFCRIGAGSLGGKGRGLALVNLLVSEHELDGAFPGVRISVPPAVVLGTEVFDRFLEENRLRDFAIECPDDGRVARAFAAASLPRDVTERLSAYLALARYPIAARSSSLLEDSRYQPFAGVYDTWMLPNAHADFNVRFVSLLDAIKKVYASTFFSRAKAYFAGSPYRLEEEKMAVIIQRIAGARHGHRYYPDLAGVARSHNFYPVPPLKPHDGIAAVALGLGATVVEGAICFRFCPRHPQRPAQFLSVEHLLTDSQRDFYALPLDPTPAGDKPLEPVQFPLEVAERDGTLGAVGSTYSPEDHAIHDGVSRPGVRLVTFAPVLKHGVFPLAKTLETLLDICSAATSSPVEIEFAVTLSTPSGAPKEFAFLQLRPVALTRTAAPLELDDSPSSRLICRSSAVLGHGILEGIRDLVVVDAHRFDRARSTEVARQVARCNAALQADRVPYILIGVGRWGSTDPFLGIPVTWDQISGAHVIVEAGFRDRSVIPSQGSHFFQNLTARSVGYFTVDSRSEAGFVDWPWLAAQPAVSESTFVRHIRLDAPAVVKMDGRHQRGIICRP
ncbi:MAG: histidine kinase [Acidobacteria bacterium RIFCSPLOWO2_02_FULL_67_36]|nr:MAG: histidine kinase [Acidobacteria bacterium RIFCSPLOWO2_02_FULL_67_36]OFW19793.1 MAG: histidine kinase [Acidobacteria bacterium RIFCSPLOWO2_12_FULL_66_21]